MAIAAKVAAALVRLDRAGEALDVLAPLPEGADLSVELTRAQAMLAQGDPQEAARRFAAIRDDCESRMRRAMSSHEWNYVQRLHGEASRLYDALYAELHGREGVVVEPAVRGRLDAHAGVNYRLLGQSLMVESPRRARHLHLRTPEQTAEAARRLLAADRGSSEGLALAGEAELRREHVAEALDLFERACAADGRNFAAFLGVGSSMDFDRYGLLAAAKRIPDLPEPAGLAGLVLDGPALTALEARVVRASLHPLRGAIPALAEAGARLRILPIAVRPTDLPELAELAGVRENDDHRAYDALGGLAGHGLAVSKIEDLLDIESVGGWCLAHELAHLVQGVLPEHWAEEVSGLYERTAGVGWVGDDYQMSNEHEFFAVAYTDFLRQRYGCATYKEIDDEGVLAAIFAFFERAASSERF